LGYLGGQRSRPRHGKIVDVVGLNAASATMVERFGVHDKPEAIAGPSH
jgi:SulP family sulfate permease